MPNLEEMTTLNRTMARHVKNTLSSEGIDAACQSHGISKKAATIMHGLPLLEIDAAADKCASFGVLASQPILDVYFEMSQRGCPSKSEILSEVALRASKRAVA